MSLLNDVDDNEDVQLSWYKLYHQVDLLPCCDQVANQDDTLVI